MLLDSTFLNDLIREEQAAVTKLETLVERRTAVALCPVTVFEVGVGLRGDAVTFRGRFQDTVEELDTVPFGTEQARRAMAIQRELYDRGEPIGAVDALIAGTAATRSDRRVLTRNVDEFARVDSVSVEQY